MWLGPGQSCWCKATISSLFLEVLRNSPPSCGAFTCATSPGILYYIPPFLFFFTFVCWLLPCFVKLPLAGRKNTPGPGVAYYLLLTPQTPKFKKEKPVPNKEPPNWPMHVSRCCAWPIKKLRWRKDQQGRVSCAPVAWCVHTPEMIQILAFATDKSVEKKKSYAISDCWFDVLLLHQVIEQKSVLEIVRENSQQSRRRHSQIDLIRRGWAFVRLKVDNGKGFNRKEK